MTEGELRVYISKGDFSDIDEISSKKYINEIKDIRVWTIYDLLYNDITRTNATEFFKLLWGDSEVSTYLKFVAIVKSWELELAALEKEKDTVETRIKELRTRIYNTRKQMQGELDYYDNPKDYDNTTISQWQQIRGIIAKQNE